MYDYMEIYAKWDRAVEVKESNKLDWVAEHVCGQKKVEHQLGFKEFWEQQPAEYVLYNAIDSILIREIDNSIKTSSAFLGLANLMHVDALTAFSPVRSLEIVQAEYQYAAGKVFPAGGKKGGSNDGYEGAFVYDPIPGLYKNVIALDFASLYPTTMRQFNISPDTYIKKDKNYHASEHEIKCVSGAIYKKDFEGFIPKILTDFYTQRKKYKKEMMIAIDEKYYLQDIYEKRFGKLDED
jgi:DNA polymerase elongation subunit (family B)